MEELKEHLKEHDAQSALKTIEGKLIPYSILYHTTVYMISIIGLKFSVLIAIIVYYNYIDKLERENVIDYFVCVLN